MKKYQCPCCGYFTYNVPANEDCGYICPVCFWENDPFIASDNEPSDSNHGITLKEAKSNFSKFGACEKEMLCHVRPPRDDEKEILQRQLPTYRTEKLEFEKECDCMKKQLQGIAIILVSILLMIGFGNEPVFDLSFRWSVIFTIVGIVGTVITFLSEKK